MAALIILIVLIPVMIIVLLVLVLNKTSDQSKLMESLAERINELNKSLADLTNQVRVKEQPQVPKPFIEESPDIIVEHRKEKTQEPVEEPIPESIIPGTIVPEPFVAASEPEPLVERSLPDSPFAREKWLPKNTDWEKFIGENLANKIGIGVLVLGIAFFVKYAIDKQWINEVGRVIIGLISGGILIGLAHYVRGNYRSFSSVLVGGGLTVFYITIAFAFHEYHLIGQQAAFFIMVALTGFAVALSLLYDRLELAVLATIGGFITPFLVTTEQDNYIVLFTYLCILNTGLMFLAWFKRWPSINVIALIFTVLIYGSWLTNKLVIENAAPFPFRNALLFASIFYALFMTMSLVNNLKEKRKFKAIDFSVVLSVNGLYYAAGMTILQYWNEGAFQGLFTAALGIVNLVLARSIFRNTLVDKNLVYLLIGLTLTFISLAAPVQLHGNYITLFWSAEAVVLFWLYQRSRISLIKIASLLIAALMMISLVMDWGQIYFDASNIIPVLANKGFITTIVASAALFIYYGMMRREADTFYLPGIRNTQVRNTLLVSATALAFIAGLLETYYQFNTRLPGTGIHDLYIQLYSFAAAIILLKVFSRSAAASVMHFAVPASCFLLYSNNLDENKLALTRMLESGANTSHFLAHWIGALLLLYLLYTIIVFFRRNSVAWASYQVYFTSVAAACIVFLLSIELHHAMRWMNYTGEGNWAYWQNLYSKAGLSILWSICSFIMMWLGMKHKFGTLRILSLTLFTITLVKLFSFDIRNIPPGGKITAFVLLGILLLTVSFMYQRLKKMILDESPEEK